MLGLFNFFALPRRFGLDFRDVTASGLAFDTLSGRFDLGGGNAVTDDLTVNGPSLRVEVDGRIGLAAQDYDQRIRIYPDVSGGMTIGGAVLGGPLGVGPGLARARGLRNPHRRGDQAQLPPCGALGTTPRLFRNPSPRPTRRDSRP